MSQTVSATNPLGTEKIGKLMVRYAVPTIIALAENYDLCLNSSKLGIDGCVNLILDCCK